MSPVCVCLRQGQCYHQMHKGIWDFEKEGQKSFQIKDQFFKKARQKTAWWPPENMLKATWLFGYPDSVLTGQKKKKYVKHVSGKKKSIWSIVTHHVDLRRNYQRLISRESRKPPPASGEADAWRGVLAERETSGNQTNQSKSLDASSNRISAAHNLLHSCSILRLSLF